MDITEESGQVESVTMSDVLQLGWERERSTDELMGFIARREAAVADLSDE
jgi:hypothetical protein